MLSARACCTQSRPSSSARLDPRANATHVHAGDLRCGWSDTKVKVSDHMTGGASGHRLAAPSLIQVQFSVATLRDVRNVHGSARARGGPSHGPGDVGRVLFGLHAQHGDAGRAPLKLGLGLEGVVAVGAGRQQRVCAEEVVEGDMAELVLLVGEAHVAVVGGAGG